MKYFLVLFAFIIQYNSLLAQNSGNEFKNNVAINLLAIPVGNGVISYERNFNKQSVWIGYEHHFNASMADEDKNLNSIAMEYRRYLMNKKEGANGLFAGVYSKYRTGKETLQENATVSHSYKAIFAGLNVGYQLHIHRLVFSAFTGYGLPIYLTEEKHPANSSNDLNKGYKNDLRIGLTAGFAF